MNELLIKMFVLLVVIFGTPTFIARFRIKQPALAALLATISHISILLVISPSLNILFPREFVTKMMVGLGIPSVGVERREAALIVGVVVFALVSYVVNAVAGLPFMWFRSRQRPQP